MTEEPSQSWLNLQVTVGAEEIDEAEQTLFDLGAVSISLLDAADHPLHEPGPGEMPVWPKVVVQALLPGSVSRALVTDALLKTGLIDAATALAWSDLVDRDWTRAWMDRYRPMQFGHGLWICPSHVDPDPAWPLVIKLDPGLAFGSGTHPTTALCLEWIAALEPDIERVIDFGCGSGVLAIAAALKGAREVIAIDHDPQALSATLENARRNAVADRITAIAPLALNDRMARGETAQLVVANILARPLIDLAPTLAHRVEPGGALVLSGILPEQAEAVAEAYRSLDPQPTITQRDGWVRIVCRAYSRPHPRTV
ncbi:50S ribosomal protein L11 methyltransferase [Wenzhouxiangella limi]|uniref:Ribosomal protein L11 methyltransferase n=1 Tax=Wenzhouxiangella limi TaxID=2707351 RepID=A0A845VGW7_9GAMM|nr:50S ribosomal protein L11 methyltransferase [Wenzhouxiangella limi]NDY96449.1 50S ribosomal protein L11 methyltransferase [Wenzhouxiangella limi]